MLTLFEAASNANPRYPPMVYYFFAGTVPDNRVWAYRPGNIGHAIEDEDPKATDGRLDIPRHLASFPGDTCSG